MNTQILFLYPTGNGLKSFIKVDDEVYFITFTSNNNEAEFRVYHKDPDNILLIDSTKREGVLNDFTAFLKEHRDQIKLGVYFSGDEALDLAIKELSFTVYENNIQANFSILDQPFVISGLKTKVIKSETVLDSTFANYHHCNENCICNEVKQKHKIEGFEDCLILFEHLPQITMWLSERYREQFLYTNEPENKIIELY